MPTPHSNSFALTLVCLGFAALSACGTDIDPTHLEGPLLGGDAEWPEAPIPQPGGNGAPPTGGDGDGDQGTGGDPTGDGDPGGDGWGGDGDGDPTGDGDGDPTTGDGDGDGDPGEVPCLDPADGLSCGEQIGICEAAPMVEVPEQTIACCPDQDCGCVDGLCSAAPCSADGWCDCHCPLGSDPDCQPDSCAMPAPGDEEAATCPDAREPVVLYMSNDDSNSQASPTYVRRLVSEGLIVPAHAVRIHEFLNYYDLSYANPSNELAKVGIQMRRTNKDTGEFTLLLSAQGQRIDPDERPRFNLVYSLDMSGSMSGEPIELLKDTVRATAGQLRAGDTVSLVGWDTLQSTLLDGHVVSGPNDPSLLAAIDSIEAGGGTDLHAGLVSAYSLANEHYIAGGINRVFLVSDGGANAGVTDTELIAAEAEDNDGEDIYLIGVGVSEASGYSDDLMDEVTDAGKGAYLFVDSTAEAERMFGDPVRFLANTTIVARDVRMQLIMPWYFGVKEFHGEEYSENPAEVEPQHLAANDAMSFHQVLQSCDPEAPKQDDVITARVTYRDPVTFEERIDQLAVPLQTLVESDASQLYKGDVIVNYAKAYIAISAMVQSQNHDQAIATAAAMVGWLELAATKLDDAEIAEMAAIMDTYRAVLEVL